MHRMYADGGDELSTILQRVKQRGLTTSLDMARPDPASPAGRADWRTILASSLPYVDIFLPSLDETLFMLDRTRFDEMQAQSTDGDLNANADGPLLRALADELIGMGAAIVGLKLGAQGLYLRTTPDSARLASAGRAAPPSPDAWSGLDLLAPCLSVDVVGTTGSGDCTIAGFLGGILNRLSPEDTITAAVAVGACNVEAADATSGIPNWSVVQRRLAAGWARRPVACDLPGWTWDDHQQIWRGH